MTEGHTRGPWHFDGLCQIVEAARPHMRVCFLPSDHAEYSSSVPNGYLIAAAPDLLEALKATLEEIERVEADVEYKLPCGDKARAAIARAEGSAV